MGKEPWRTVAVRETVAWDRAVRGAVCQETEPCGGWAVRGSPRHKPNRGGSVRSVRTAAVCGTVVNTKSLIVTLLFLYAQCKFDLTYLYCLNLISSPYIAEAQLGFIYSLSVGSSLCLIKVICFSDSKSLFAF